MNRLLNHVRGNVVAYLALFVALGGSSYAAFSLPAGSVGTSQLKNGSVTPIKLNSGKIGAYVRAWAVIEGGNQIVESHPRAHIVDWDPTSATGDVSWKPSIASDCFVVASGGGNFVQAAVRSHFRGLRAVVHFGTYTNSGQPDSGTATIAVVAALCPH